MKNQKFKLCLTTVDCEVKAQNIAKELLQQKLVACVNISAKMKSLYHWQGEINETQEYLLLMKTSAEKVVKLELTLSNLHPYDVPEFIVINIDDGSSNYFSWINSSLN